LPAARSEVGRFAADIEAKGISALIHDGRLFEARERFADFAATYPHDARLRDFRKTLEVSPH
jgi:hypothetical protein